MTTARLSQSQPSTSNSAFVMISVSMLLLLVLANIFYSVRAIQTGFKVASLEKEKATLLSEKHALSEQITQKRSLGEISTYANAEGFVAITDTVALQLPSDTSVALR